MTDQPFKRNAGVFVAAFLSAVAAALTTGASLAAMGGFSLGLVGASLLISAFALPAFLVVFALLGLLFVGIESRLKSLVFRLVYFVLLGTAAGFGIPFVMGAFVGSPKMAAVGGFVGGIVYAYVWGRSSTFKIDEEDAGRI